MKKGIDTNSENKPLVDEDDYEYEKQLAEKVINERKKAEEERIKKERTAREEREKQIAKDRLELLQLKNGVIDEEHSTIKEEKEETIELHGKAKIANIWYHYKIMIIFIIFLVAVVGIIIYDTVTREKADIYVLMIADNGLADRQQDIEEFFEKYTEDVDGNGYVHVGVIMIPQYQNDLQQQGVNNSKLVAQLQLADSIIVITDSNTDDRIKAIMKHDLNKDFPGNKYIDELGLSLNMKVASKALNYEQMPNDVHISLRNPVDTTGDSLKKMQKNYDISFRTFKAITDDLTRQAEETNDPGLTTKPIQKDDSSSVSSSSESMTDSNGL